MYRYNRSLLTIALAALGAVPYTMTNAAENDAVAAANSKISLTQAITTAEQFAQGRATRARYQHSEKGRVYDVEVVNGAKVVEVKVDAEKGTVISSTEDSPDPDDDDDDGV